MRADALAEGRRSPLTSTCSIGGRWLAENATPLLHVPSVILPDTWNLLINPLHPDAEAKLRVIKSQRVPLDSRLL